MNGQFDYVMALISIIVGLGLTHILGAFGSAVHRLRGHGAPIRLEATYLFWVGFVMLWMVSFWWWEFTFKDLRTQWTYGLYLFLILYAVLLFLLVVILVPKDMEGLDDSFEYFMSGRRWFFGTFILANGIDVLDSLIKSTEWGLRPTYLAMVGCYFAGGLIGMRARRRSVQLGLAIVLFAYQLVFTWGELDILGNL
jgi:hypothetical protein